MVHSSTNIAVQEEGMYLDEVPRCTSFYFDNHIQMPAPPFLFLFHNSIHK